MRFRPSSLTLPALFAALATATAVMPGCGSSSSSHPSSAFTAGIVKHLAGDAGYPGPDLRFEANPEAPHQGAEHRITIRQSGGTLRVSVERGAQIESVPQGSNQDPAIPKPCAALAPNAIGCRAAALGTVYIDFRDSTGDNTVRVSPPGKTLPVDVFAHFGLKGESRLIGGGETDTCAAATSADDLNCDLGGGDDVTYGLGGNDRIIGGPGRDNCIADGGRNVVQGCELHIAIG